MSKKYHNIFSQLQAFEQHLSRLEERCLQIEQRIEKLIQIERNHMIRIKNREEVSDDFLYHGRMYQDISPEKAWKLYCDRDFDFILIDVSSSDYEAPAKIPEALHIPWEEFKDRFIEITSRTTPILVISEDGTNSVLACEFLVSRGYYNCNNISGGYKHWKGMQIQAIRTA